MPNHIWGGAESRSSDRFHYFYDREERLKNQPCKPAGKPKSKNILSWLLNRGGQRLIAGNIFIALAFGLILVPILTRSDNSNIITGWEMGAVFFKDENSAILSLTFTSNNPKPADLELLIGEQERPLQKIFLKLPDATHYVFRERLDFVPSGDTLELWVGTGTDQKKVLVSDGS